MTARLAMVGMTGAGLLATVAALAGCHTEHRSTHVAPPRVAPRPAPATAATRPDPAVTIASRYALAARNWSAATYTGAWRRQLALSTGRYRRALRAAPPTGAQLDALRTDRASNLAVITHARRDPRARPPRARVVVWLDERTATGGHAVPVTSRNRVRLVLRDGHWRVTGWTTLPEETERRG